MADGKVVRKVVKWVASTAALSVSKKADWMVALTVDHWVALKAENSAGWMVV